MNDIILIDICQAHLPVQYFLNIKLIRQKWNWYCDWQWATPDSYIQNKPLVFSIGCPCSTDYSAFPFDTPTKPLIQLHIKYKTVLFHKL